MSIMVLGTASHVGKSVTVAAICRHLSNQGYRVSPFKSQNMSLNSYVTTDGAEIGIAQAMQAKAARAEPEARMNPVLLKPKGNCTSEVVLLGHHLKDVEIGKYYNETGELLKVAVSAYRELEKEYSNIVIEGAGGAAELNLYDRDIANILLARELGLPIILVADIERGGVFAQIYGTISLLPEDIRPLVVGIIINKFCGDPALFESGIPIIEELTGVPVLGIVPSVELNLPSEDSLSIDDKKNTGSSVRIVVIRLPHISNFTDFEVLESHASVDYVRPGDSLDGYDCIILPGTKNTVEDLRDLKERGGDLEIIKARQRGIPVIGICGGYQMLGREIQDLGIEAGHGVHAGLGLLDTVTFFDREVKTTSQVRRHAAPLPPILADMGEVTGYEIHMGRTERGDVKEAFSGEGAVSDDGLVIGTYMHGLFRTEKAADALLSYLSEKKGVTFTGMERDEIDPYDALAAHFAEHIDMEKIVSFFSRPQIQTRGN